MRAQQNERRPRVTNQMIMASEGPNAKSRDAVSFLNECQEQEIPRTSKQPRTQNKLPRKIRDSF